MKKMIFIEVIDIKISFFFVNHPQIDIFVPNY